MQKHPETPYSAFSNMIGYVKVICNLGNNVCHRLTKDQTWWDALDCYTVNANSQLIIA